MTEEHNVPEAPVRQETDAEKIERLEKRENELNEQVQNQANRIETLSNKLEEQGKSFRMLADGIRPYLDIPGNDELEFEDRIEGIIDSKFDDSFTDKFSDHINDVTVEIDSVDASLSY